MHHQTCTSSSRFHQSTKCVDRVDGDVDESVDDVDVGDVDVDESVGVTVVSSLASSLTAVVVAVVVW